MSFSKLVLVVVALTAVVPSASVEISDARALHRSWSAPPFAPPSWAPLSLTPPKAPLRIGSLHALSSPNHQLVLEPPPQVTHSFGRAGTSQYHPVLDGHRAALASHGQAAVGALKRKRQQDKETERFAARVHGIAYEAAEDVQHLTHDSPRTHQRINTIIEDSRHRAGLPLELHQQSAIEAEMHNTEFIRQRESMRSHVRALQQGRAWSVGSPGDENHARRLRKFDRALDWAPPRRTPDPERVEAADVQRPRSA